MINNNIWMNQYQSVQQAQNMFNMMENQQNMFNNFPQMNPNQFNNFPGVQGGWNNNFNNNQNNNNKYSKINLCFSTIQGSRIMMKINPEDTVEQVLEKYLLRVNLPDLINNLQGKLTFILSAQSLKFGDKRKIKEVAMVGNLNQILVNDTNNLIGAYKKIGVKTNDKLVQK